MDEKTAWQCFLKTGKVSDYLRYTEARNCSITDVKKDVSDDHKDGRTYNQRADCGGE